MIYRNVLRGKKKWHQCFSATSIKKANNISWTINNLGFKYTYKLPEQSWYLLCLGWISTCIEKGCGYRNNFISTLTSHCRAHPTAEHIPPIPILQERGCPRIHSYQLNSVELTTPTCDHWRSPDNPICDLWRTCWTAVTYTCAHAVKKVKAKANCTTCIRLSKHCGRK